MSSNFFGKGGLQKESKVPETSMIIHKRAVKIQDSPEQTVFHTLQSQNSSVGLKAKTKISVVELKWIST